jgi:NitT/TauT family transport system ATP-binding protein
VTDRTPRVLSASDLVGELLRLAGRGFPREDVHRLLAETRLEPASLDRHVRFAPGLYTRHLVHKSPEVEILVLCWARGSRAPIHGHEGELCWARVERGTLRFANWREVSRTPLRVVPVGEPMPGGPGYLDGPADLHSVENPAALDQDAVSLHVYSKPYDECDIYDVERGEVRRVRLQYDSVPDSGSAP